MVVGLYEGKTEGLGWSGGAICWSIGDGLGLSVALSGTV